MTGASGTGPDRAAWLFAGTVLVALAQTVVLDAGSRPLRSAVPWAVAAAVVVLGSRMRVGGDEVAGRRWLVGIALAEVVLAIWAVQAFLRALPAGVGEPSGFYRVKVLVTTPLGDHNTAAGLLLVGVVATVLLARDDRRWWFGVATTLAGFVACLSRGAALVLVAVALVAWVVGVRRWVAAALTSVAVVALAGVVTLAVVLDASPPAGADVPDGPVGTSVVGRVDLAARGVEVFLDHPPLGVGLGGFGDRTSDLPPPNEHAHNTFAHAAAEGGVPHLALTLGVVLLLAWRGLRAPPGWRRELVLLGGAGLVAQGQIDVLGGLLATEVLLAALLVVAAAGPDPVQARR